MQIAIYKHKKTDENFCEKKERDYTYLSLLYPKKKMKYDDTLN